MAINTALANLPELPLRFGRGSRGNIPFFQMTGKTRGGNMRTIQFILRFGVVFNGENAAQKAISGMALGTIRADIVNSKLFFVVILMAICTVFKWQRIGHFIGGVALSAIHCNVFSFEGKSRFIVVKLIQIARFSPAAFIVTIYTFPAKFPFVYILVTTFTIVRWDT